MLRTRLLRRLAVVLSVSRIAVFLTAGICAGQDPLQVLPRNYSLAFENEYVRVLRVYYGPHEKLPVHDHSKTPTVYVYLADAGPVKFIHTGFEALERPAVKTGGFRLSPGFVETHEVENLSDKPNEFLRVELKKIPLGRQAFKGRFPPRMDAAPGAKVEFEDAKLRILRMVCQAQAPCDSRRSAEPALLIDFSDSGVHWIPANSDDAAVTPLHALRIEFKAGP